MKNKLFFFGAFNPQYQRRKFTAPTGFPLASLNVATNGSQPAIEQARTDLENAYPTGTGLPPPQTLGEALSALRERDGRVLAGSSSREGFSVYSP